MATSLRLDYNAASDPRSGIFYINNRNYSIFAKYPSGATSYEVRDFYGNIVSQGPISSSLQSNPIPTPPEGGWRCGWYFFAALGPDQGAPQGTCYGGGWFHVVPDDPHFMTVPPGNTNMAGGNGETPDVIVKGFMGVGMSRLTVLQVDQPNFSANELNSQILMAGDVKTWWTNVASQYQDTVRPPRRMWCLFANGTYDELYLPGAGNTVPQNTGGNFGKLYVADASLSPEKIFVQIGPGTVSGTKIQVFSPAMTTLQETYDNLSDQFAANAAIQGVSNLIYFYSLELSTPGTQGPIAIGRTRLWAPSNKTYCECFCIDGNQANNTYVQINPGTTANTAKIRVYVGGTAAGNIVETYDNLATNDDAIAAINSTSTRIRAFKSLGATISGTPANMTTPVRMDSTYLNGLKTCVSQLYAAGCTHFEGPANEPRMADLAVVQQSKLFIQAVHTTSGAKAIGPCSSPLGADNLYTFMNTCNNRGIKFDELATHAYDMSVFLWQDRPLFDYWKSRIEAAGWDDLTLWETEVNAGAINIDGLALNIRDSVRHLYYRLLLEEKGFYREYAPPWYDKDHGFLSIPSYSEQNNNLVQPQWSLLRTLTAETWGMLLQSTYVFPNIWDHFLMGYRYAGATEDTIVLFTRWLPEVDFTFVTDIKGNITITDAWGNKSVTSADEHREFTVTAQPIVYVRIPHNSEVTLKTVNNWSRNEREGGDAALYQPATVDGAGAGVITSPVMGSNFTAAGQVPSTIIIPLGEHRNFYRLFIMCYKSGLITFDVDTSSDGGNTWTLRKSVDTSVTGMADSVGHYTTDAQLQSYWHFQQVFDVSMPTPLQGTTHVRIRVSRTSYQDVPDLVMATKFGKPTSNQVSLIRIMAIADGTRENTYVETLINDGVKALYTLGESTANSPTSDIIGNTTSLPFLNPAGVVMQQPSPGARGSTAAKFQFAGSTFSCVAGNWVYPQYLNVQMGDFFSIEFWVNLTNLPGSGTANFVGMAFRKMQIASDGTISSPSFTSLGKLTVDGNWHHIVWTKNGTTNVIWKDAVDISGTSNSKMYSADTGTPYETFMFINGDSAAASRTAGTYWMVGVYPLPLSQAQVLDHYKKGLTKFGIVSGQLLGR